MQARYYDPVIGRFYSNDPIGFTGDITTFNRFSYVGNNPYKYTDPTGMSRVSNCGEGSASCKSFGGSGSNSSIGSSIKELEAAYQKFTGEAIEAQKQIGATYLGAALMASPIDEIAIAAGVLRVTKGTGTVWDSVKATQGAIKGTSIPKSFELAVNGGKFWVHPNATKHMAEYLTRNGMSHGTAMSSQAMLKSFQSAVNQAVSRGYKSGEMIQAGRWEIMFGAGKAGDALPVIKHALYK